MKTKIYENQGILKTWFDFLLRMQSVFIARAMSTEIQLCRLQLLMHGGRIYVSIRMSCGSFYCNRCMRGIQLCKLQPLRHGNAHAMHL